MNRHVLLSSIGRSPGAVTGIYYALQEKDVGIDAIVLLSTALGAVRDSAAMVRDELGEDKVFVVPLRTPNREKETMDFDNEDAAVDFIRLVNAVLVRAREAQDRVSLGITAGRSSMGALATLSAYVYGAAGVYHLWVDQEIERGGDIDNLNTFNRDHFLNPPSNLRRLIDLRLEDTFDAQLKPGTIPDFADRHPNLLRAVTDVELAEFKKVKLDYRAGEMGIPGDELRKLRATLLRCAPVDSDQDLRALFDEDVLRPWRDRVPEANSRHSRVDRLVSFLWNEWDDHDERVLCHFLRALHSRVCPNILCARDLAALLEQSKCDATPNMPLSGTPAAPVMSYEDVVREVRRIFAGSELAPVLDQAIVLAQLSGKGSDPEAILKLAESLKPHFKPGLWEQVVQDLQDWDSWKAGADRLLSFIEAVATPLAVAGMAAILGLNLP